MPKLEGESIPGPFGTLSSSLFTVVLHVVVEVGRHVPEQQAAIVPTAAEECSNNKNQLINTRSIFDSNTTDLLQLSADQSWI